MLKFLVNKLFLNKDLFLFKMAGNGDFYDYLNLFNSLIIKLASLDEIFKDDNKEFMFLDLLSDVSKYNLITM